MPFFIATEVEVEATADVDLKISVDELDLAELSDGELLELHNKIVKELAYRGIKDPHGGHEAFIPENLGESLWLEWFRAVMKKYSFKEAEKKLPI